MLELRWQNNVVTWFICDCQNTLLVILASVSPLEPGPLLENKN